MEAIPESSRRTGMICLNSGQNRVPISGTACPDQPFGLTGSLVFSLFRQTGIDVYAVVHSVPSVPTKTHPVLMAGSEAAAKTMASPWGYVFWQVNQGTREPLPPNRS